MSGKAIRINGLGNKIKKGQFFSLSFYGKMRSQGSLRAKSRTVSQVPDVSADFLPLQSPAQSLAERLFILLKMSDQKQPFGQPLTI